VAKPTFDWDSHMLNLLMVNNDIVDAVKTQAAQYSYYLKPYKDIFNSQYQLPDHNKFDCELILTGNILPKTRKLGPQTTEESQVI
jgi:hypothetical protein